MIRRSIAVSAFLLAMVICYPSAPGLAQNPPSPPVTPPPQPPPPKPNTDSPVQSAPDQPKWDPLRADKDVEVGKYYMNKGDIDAAIDRFNDALDAKPGFAIPYRYLGECYEKKGQKKPAVKAYQRYLDLYPKAEDGDKIRKKVEKLHKEIDKEKSSPL
ncbi:MAG TPA: tetratricopeptide repeat protein [Verrucomicrobiae bacterium]|nr:tetratricopeptide repeat protein [Verrucomicrobiae bacterium]